ncbi:sulfurtransferase [Roseomonas sp. CECT 9278]|uniref:sulfurtransferase n=1 Tax=Roseomonas sp. CECT 9278 TaxID=2845823 RepID=UPI001E35A47B|nr:rhodanese-like domain-containing protein [Roseomonas sp. CECT 9278]CAH0192627.1 Putative thiosulfate sulfurtransferase SseB [Roseomonas sp. CECT 9278]
MDPRETVFITAAALGERLAAGAPLSVLAVRNPRLPEHADAPRIPGAIDIDLPTELAAPGGGTRGSRPLPAIDALQRDAIRWGLRRHVPVVLYDHDRCLTAARGWWVLRWAGLTQVLLLDGGFPAWLAARLPVGTLPATPAPGDVVLSAGHMPVLDADAAAAMARDGVLLDTRIRGNYIGGATVPGQPPRGHIPGSVSAPAADALTEAGTFLDAATLRHLFETLGADGRRPLGVTCGAGISAAHGVAALASIGVAAAMYSGSWSAWAADPARPVVVGGRPG